MQRLWPAIAGWLAGAAAATPVTSRPSPTGPMPWTAPALPRADSHHGTRRVGHHAGGHAAEQRPDEPRLAMGAHHDHHGVTPTRRPEDLLVRQTRDQMRSDLGPMSRASKSAYGVAHIASAFLSGGRTRMSPRNPPMKADEIRSLPEHPYAPVRPLALLKLRCDTASNSTMARRGTSVLTPDGGQWSAR